MHRWQCAPAGPVSDAVPIPSTRQSARVMGVDLLANQTSVQTSASSGLDVRVFSAGTGDNPSPALTQIVGWHARATT